MKIYTRTGDAGTTALIGGRVAKDDAQVEAYGTIDELNACVGVAIASLESSKFSDMVADLLTIQHELFDCGGDLAFIWREDSEKQPPYKVTAAMTTQLEEWIDRYDGETAEITRFILPGGSVAATALHVCRTVCRRAERRMVTLAQRQPIPEHVRTYVNRLSDLFFTLARVANARYGCTDVYYARSADVFRTTR